MKSLVSAELLKLRSTRSAWIPLAVALAMAVAAVMANTMAAGHGGNPHLSPAALPGLLRASGGQIVDGAVLLAWIVLSAGEFRHRTSVTTFLSEPNRLRIVAAKLICAALTGAAVGLLAEALSAATSAASLSAHHVPLAWSQPGVLGAAVAAAAARRPVRHARRRPRTAAAQYRRRAGLGTDVGVRHRRDHPRADRRTRHHPLAARSLRKRRAARRISGRHRTVRGRGTRGPCRLRGCASGRGCSTDRPARDRHHHELTSQRKGGPGSPRDHQLGPPGPLASP